MKFKCIKKACEITDSIFSELIKHKFLTEKEIELFILTEIRNRKLKPSFPPIVATSKNAANPHHVPKKTKLKGFTVIDFGVRYNGYCSDMTRMIYYGKPNKKELELYELCLKVQKNAIKRLKIGVKYSNVAEEVREALGKYAEFFIHSLGHGVGRKIHQSPKIGVKSRDIAKKEIITIEPGIYIKNKLGIRIEDTIEINRKIKVLTKTSKKLVIK